MNFSPLPLLVLDSPELVRAWAGEAEAVAAVRTRADGAWVAEPEVGAPDRGDKVWAEEDKARDLVRAAGGKAEEGEAEGETKSDWATGRLSDWAIKRVKEERERK